MDHDNGTTFSAKRRKQIRAHWKECVHTFQLCLCFSSITQLKANSFPYNVFYLDFFFIQRVSGHYHHHQVLVLIN